MSASLVGSEMCIRDSAIHAVPGHLRGACLVHAGDVDPRAPCEHGVRTVSYTHLTLPTICSV
eukprot:1599457-Alexandrium_andersonii.AAC.1